VLLSDIYIAHLIFTVFLCLINIRHSNYLYYFAIIYHVLFLVLTRTVEFKQDLMNYYNYAVWNIILVREPIFTLINSFSYRLFGQEFVFLIVDTLSVYLIYRTIKNRNLNYIYLFCFMCFFPVIMGFQSVYRQHFGTLILLWVMSVQVDKSKFKQLTLLSKLKKAVGLLAPITHNLHLMSLFASLITRFNSILIISMAFFLSWGLVNFYSILGKPNTNTGGSTAFLYVIVLIILSLVFWKFNRKYAHKFCLFALIIVASLTLVGLETPAERTGIAFLILIYPMLAEVVEYGRPKRIVRAGFAIMGCVPIFVSAARTLLQAEI
jgi:hypothetical protein